MDAFALAIADAVRRVRRLVQDAARRD
jgi:hypothetical protein